MPHELSPIAAMDTQQAASLHTFGILYQTRPVEAVSFLDESAFLKCQEEPHDLLSRLQTSLDAIGSAITSSRITADDHVKIRECIQTRHPRALSMAESYYDKDRADIVSLPYSNFELMLATSLATPEEKNVWNHIHQIEERIHHLISSNPSEFWNTIRLFRLDLILPPFARMNESQKNTIASILERESENRQNPHHNRRIFREALESAVPEFRTDSQQSDKEFLGRTIRLLPNLDQYYDPALPEGQSQKPEYYMTLVHMAAHRTRIPGWEPFTAMLVRDGVIMKVTNNIPIKVTKPELHQYHHAERLLLEDPELLKETGGDFSGCEMYCSASPCGECAGAMRKFRVGPRVFIGIETAMGESSHGILRSHLQDQGPPYTEPPHIEYVNPGGIFRTLYVVDMGWSVFIPEFVPRQ